MDDASQDAKLATDAGPLRHGKDRRRDRLLGYRKVVERTALSISTIYRREREGTFPRKEQIGYRRVAWYESDIDDFVADPLGYRAGQP